MGRTILIALIVAIIVGGAAGYGGYTMGNDAGFQHANQIRQQFAQTRQGGQGGQSGQGQGGFGGNRAFELQGTVKSIDGNTMVVTIGQRDVTVTLTDKTEFLKSVAGARADLAAGARVMVAPIGGNGGSGGAGGNGGGGGAMTAVSVTVLPAQ